MSPDPVATAIELLALPDEAFFTLDAAVTMALQARLARLVQPSPMSQPPTDVPVPLPELRVIGAPTQLDWHRRTSFPLLLAEIRSNRREWEVNAVQNRLLMMSNLGTGAVDLMAPLDEKRRLAVRPPSGSGTPPDAFNAGLSSIGVRPYNLLRWFSREQAQGRLALTVLDYDLVSNTVLVHGWGASAAPTEGVLAWGATRLGVQPVAPTAGSVGVTLQVPATVSAAPPALLRAELRLPRSHVAAVGAPAQASHKLLLAATLLLVQRDGPTPVLLHLAAPAAVDAAGNIEAAFDLDLGGALAGRAATGDWLVYLVVGDTLTGPRPLRVELP